VVSSLRPTQKSETQFAAHSQKSNGTVCGPAKLGNPFFNFQNFQLRVSTKNRKKNLPKIEEIHQKSEKIYQKSEKTHHLSLLNGPLRTKFSANIKLNSRELASARPHSPTQRWEVQANNGLILRLSRYSADFRLGQKSANHLFHFIDLSWNAIILIGWTA